MQVEEESYNSENGTSSNSESTSDSTSLEDNKKTRSVREIYEQENEFDQHNMFACLSSQPTHFEEEVKEKHWVEEMN